MRRLFAAALFLSAAGPAVAADDYPHVYLKNDKLKVKVYLPDAEKGFYRGTRFDHAVVFGEVEFAGHKLFGPWKEKHDPTNHDDIIGPAEEFGMQEPLGYADAKAGGTFLKIGVGELEKPKEEKYHFANKYKVVKPAGWKVSAGGGDLRVKDRPGAEVNGAIDWQMEQKANGYGYRYEKFITLDYEKLLDFDKKGPGLLVLHRLENTGDKPITTDFYNHNFFNVDGDGVGPNYSIAFPFDVGAKDQKGKFGESVELKGKELRFKEKLTDGFVMAGLTGFDPERNHFGFDLRHGPSRVTVRVDGFYPLAKLNVWGVKTTICPEPFFLIENLKPGKSQHWAILYTFSQDPPKK